MVPYYSLLAKNDLPFFFVINAKRILIFILEHFFCTLSNYSMHTVLFYVLRAEYIIGEDEFLFLHCFKDLLKESCFLF